MKLFPKDAYDDDNLLLNSKTRAVFDLIRPFTLLAPFIGGILAAIMGIAYHNQWYRLSDLGVWLILLKGGIILASINAGSNTLNQISDLKIDKINKPYRPLPQGQLHIYEALVISVLFYAIGVGLSLTMSLSFFLLTFILVLLTFAYSVGPTLKKRLWLNNTSIAVSRGGIGLLAGWTMLYDPNFTILATASILTTYLIGLTSCKDFSDIKGDKKYGINTLPAYYGESTALTIMYSLSTLSFLLSLSFYVMSRLNIVVIGITSTYVITSIALSESYDYFNRETRLENNVAWIFMYGMIVFSYVAFIVMMALM